MKRFVSFIAVALLAAAQSPLVERVADTGFIQLQSASFPQLDAKQKALAYWLTQASIAIDPIIYDQLSRYGLRQKRLLEGVVAHHASVPPPVFARIREYALLFWANRGNHNEISAQKIMPSYTGFVQPRLEAVRDGQGNIIDVQISYPLDLTAQMLEYSGRR